ncbi:MAG: lipoyl(octanoyl) transferase LipB [Candidatus Krumholzibacteriia bacterium]
MEGTMRVHDLDTMPYDEAFALQKRTVQRLQSGGGEETLYLLEHPHVVTLGRNASAASLIAGKTLLESRGVTVVETDRGGDATYHGPGQLVGYPIIALEPGRRDIRRYVADVEEVLLRTLAGFSIEARRDDVHRGVWVAGRKIASVGIRISRWVTCHGFALNVDTDLSYFSLIHPCGISSCEMTSIRREIGRDIDMAAVKETIVRHFSDVFGREAALAQAEAKRYG